MGSSPRWIKPATVDRVVDGDTVVLSIDLGFGTWLHGQHVRLVAVGQDGRPASYNAPEARGPLATEAGAAATEALREMLPVGREVTIETFKGPATDKYGRWLAVIWLSRPDVAVITLNDDVATRMVSRGWGILTP